MWVSSVTQRKGENCHTALYCDLIASMFINNRDWYSCGATVPRIIFVEFATLAVFDSAKVALVNMNLFSCGSLYTPQFSLSFCLRVSIMAFGSNMPKFCTVDVLEADFCYSRLIRNQKEQV